VSIKEYLIVAITIFLFCSQGFAADYPVHQKLIFQHKLDGEIDTDMVKIENLNGDFISGQGWQSRAIDSRLLVEMKDYLPFEGTLEVKVTNFRMSNLDNDWVPVSIWSDPGGFYYNVDGTSSAYATFKTEPKYIENGRLFWKIVSTPFAFEPAGGLGYMRTESGFAEQAYDPQQTYTFKIVWTQGKIYMVLDDYVDELSNKGNPSWVEPYYYILIGDDHTNAYKSLYGAKFSDLKLYIPNAQVSFQSRSRSSFFDVDTLAGAQSVSIADVNADGWDDIYVSYCNSIRNHSDLLFVQDSEGTFTEQSQALNLQNSDCSSTAVFADFNQDGLLDLFRNRKDASNQLMIQQFDNRFNDESSQRGISQQNNLSQGVVAFDADRDGDTDIFVLNAVYAPEYYINQGDGQFVLEDRGTSSIRANSGQYFTSVTDVDVNQDGATDLFLARRNAPCVLLVNNGLGEFTDRAEAFNLDITAKVNSPVFADYDNDGDVDLFLPQAYDVTEPAPHLLVYENQKNQNFVDKSQEIGIVTDAYAVYPGDFNNDSFVDIYILKSDQNYNNNYSQIYLNNGDGSFSIEPGTGAEVIFADGRGGAAADLNRDGWIDLVGVANGGYYGTNRREYGRNHLLVNNSQNNNHYLLVEIVDDQNRRTGLGSKIWIYEPGHLNNSDHILGFRSISASQGYNSQSSCLQHFGLGEFTLCDMKVQFDNGLISQYTGVDADQLFSIVEKKSEPARIVRISSSSQQGQAGQPLDAPLRVRVFDDKDNPLPGFSVKFSIVQGNGSLGPDNLSLLYIATDEDGYAEIEWTMGTIAARTESAKAEAFHLQNELSGSPILFSAFVNVGPEKVMERRSPEDQTGTGNRPLTDSVKVFVHDGFGNPHENLSVVFQVLSGAGNIDGASQKTVFTNSAGIAAVEWTLGPNSGVRAHSLGASVTGVDPGVVFYATSTSGPPAQILKVSGDGQSGTVGSDLDDPFVVQLLDESGLPCSGYAIQFSVTSAEGMVSNAKQQSISTDSDGKASIVLTLGERAGVNNHSVTASFYELGTEIVFTASADADIPYHLSKAGGDMQAARAGATLPNPVSVQVTDQYGNPVQGQIVVFNGIEDVLVDGTSSSERITDRFGIATVQVKLGNEFGTQSLLAESWFGGYELEGSPLQFSAIASSAPTALITMSPDSVIALTSQPLSEPVRVKVVDSFGYPVSSHPVKFLVRQGSALLNGDIEEILMTDHEGVASIIPEVGNETGRWSTIFEAQSFNHLGAPLANSPLKFYVSVKNSMAQAISLVSGSGQMQQAGNVLPHPLNVKVVDSQNKPIPGHPARFTVISGGGKIGNEKKSQLDVFTDTEGIASVIYQLGPVIGNDVHVVRVTADNGLDPLSGSGLKFYASAPYGHVDLSTSSITSTTPVRADGVEKCRIEVTLVDSLGNPVPNKEIRLHISGENNLLSDPVAPTDMNGKTTATLRSTRVGKKVIQVSVGDNKFLDQKSTVDFYAGPPSELFIIAGNNQNGAINSRLEHPLVVRVVDIFGNPISDVPVFFDPLPAAGYILEEQPVISDSAGTCRVSWVLGSIIGEQKAVVRVEGLTQVQTFNAYVQTPTEKNITIIKGDEQFSIPNQPFVDSLIVQVLAQESAPLAGVPVDFMVLQGDVSLDIAKDTTDMHGYARSFLRAKGQIGPVKVRAWLDTEHQVVYNCAIANTQPDSMFLLFGDDPSTRVDDTVSPLAVKVVDRLGSPVPNVPVTFVSESEDGVVIPEQPVKTNSNGQAFVSVKLGTTAKVYHFRAQNTSLKGSPVLFSIDARPDNVFEIEKIAGDRQTARGKEILKDSLKVKVTDPYGNGVPAVPVLFNPRFNAGEILGGNLVNTDAGGIAACQWRLGTDGTQSVTVTTDSLPDKSLQFTANLQSNLPPQIFALSDTFVTVGQTLMFQILATDPEDQALALSARKLPQHAHFDSLNHFYFVWKPSINQLGMHTVDFTATDINGGTSTHRVQIDVIAQNHFPILNAWSPEDIYLRVGYFQELKFIVNAIDPDNDKLEHSWFRDDVLIQKSGGQLVLYTNTSYPEEFCIRLQISDGKNTIAHTWHVVLDETITAVELESFNAGFEYGTVTLNWTTGDTRGLVGFNIYMSENVSSGFRKLNSTIIPVGESSHFSYSTALESRQNDLYYKLEMIYHDNVAVFTDSIRLSFEQPLQSRLLTNYPNPFNMETTISFELAKQEQVCLQIYNISGQLVRTLLNDSRKSGFYKMTWDGKNQIGQMVGSGIYYCIISADSFRDHIKLVLLK
jgi:hypothetical protein